MELLEDFIDCYYDAMEPTPEENPAMWKKADSATDTEDLATTTDVQVSVLESINKKLDVLSLLHQEIKELKASLEFTHRHIETHCPSDCFYWNCCL